MKNVRRTLCLLLVLALALSLAACGKEGGTASPQATASQEYVYNAEYTQLRTGKFAMYPELFTEDGFYTTVQEKVSDETPEGSMYRYKGFDGTYETRIYFVGFDGQSRLLDKYTPIQPEEDRQLEYFSDDISSMVLNQEGQLQLIESVYAQYYEGPEDVEPESEEYYNNLSYDTGYYIRTLDSDGAVLSSAKIQTPEDAYLATYSVQPDGQGNLLCTADMSVVAVAPDGSYAYTISADTYMDNLLRLKDGRVGVTVYGENGTELRLLDLEKKAFGESFSLPNTAWDLQTGAGDYDLFYTSGISFFGLKLGSEPEKLLNWLSCDIDSDSLNRVSVAEDGTIYGILNTWDNSYENATTELAVLKKVPYDSVPHKTSLTMAVFGLDYQIRREIINFNRNNGKYRIDVTDYSEYSTDEDYSAGITKLTTEILSGNVPDILELNSLPYKQLAAKGLLEDLYPYIDRDEEYSREDFFANVLSAMEVNGGLYEFCPGFSVITAMGAKSVVGDTPGWTYQQLDAALDTMPEGCDAFNFSTTKDEMLRTCLNMDMDSFVDWTTGKCSFDSPAFTDLLVFCNRFLQEFDWEKYEYTEENDMDARIREGRQMLIPTSVYSLEDVLYNDLSFGGDGVTPAATYIGYPTNSGVGSALSLQQSYGISARCSDKEGAWEFLRVLLGPGFQQENWYLPINRNVFETRLKELMEPQYELDEEGKPALDENGEKIKRPIASVSGPDGNIQPVYEMSPAMADDLRELIGSTTKVLNTDDAVFDIVSAEAQAYFLGQKSAEEVAKLIQSKVNIYVNEQR